MYMYKTDKQLFLTYSIVPVCNILFTSLFTQYSHNSALLSLNYTLLIKRDMIIPSGEWEGSNRGI